MKVKEVKPGFEKEVELLLLKKEALEADKKEAIEKAIEKVNSEFSEREETIVSILNLITVEVEVEDPAEEVVEEEVETEEALEEKVEEVQEEVKEEKVEAPTVFGGPVNISQIKFN